ncbi:MAG TPA: AraC family transcriptional regulator ligand-binding domain-containing protein [Polyangiales bacterium]|nr:AraC family transcriptional regulator ligand-binding domain-containing protein [Polyangiales bacterium]
MEATRRARQKLHSTAEPTVPAVFALHVEAAVREIGGPSDVLLRELGCTHDELSEPSARLGVSQFVALCERGVELTREPGLGFVMAVQAPISRFGSLGFAVMASANLREALRIVERFMPIISTSLQYELREEGGQAMLELHEHWDFGGARELVLCSLTTAVWLLGEKLTGRPVLAADVEFAFPKPEHFERFAAGVPFRIAFDAAANRTRFDASYLDVPISTADPAAVRSAVAQCERELQALDEQHSLAARVRAGLWRDDQLQSPRQLARSLGMAERTLKRRLAELGTSYTQLLEAERQARAIALLRGEASVDHIADQLGYSDAANFTRAFRRWTGKSPRAFRRD